MTELFKELKEKEGIGSIDDILRQVVKPDGMSFNGIEPVYRELLMKLAMSMSKDEIFIRSQNIMNEEKGENYFFSSLFDKYYYNNEIIRSQ